MGLIVVQRPRNAAIFLVLLGPLPLPAPRALNPVLPSIFFAYRTRTRATDAATPRVVNSALETDPLTNAIFTRPVRQVSAAVNGTVEIVAE